MYLAHIKRSEAGDEGPLFWGGGLALGRDDASTRLAKNNLTNARLRRGPLKKEVDDLFYGSKGGGLQCFY